jgi:Ca2+-binding EF-hand superfamily protein
MTSSTALDVEVDKLIKLIQQKAEVKSGIGPDRALQARKLFRKAMDMPLTKDMFRENLHRVFCINLSEQTLDALFRRYDADNDGKIDMGEFAKQILDSDFPQNGRGLRFEEENPEMFSVSREFKKHAPKTRLQLFKGTVEQAESFLVGKILNIGNPRRGFASFMNQAPISGEITFDTFQKTIRNCMFVTFEGGVLEEIFRSWDTDNDGVLRYYEFSRKLKPNAFTGRSWLDDTEERGAQTVRRNKEQAKNLDMKTLPVSLAKWGWSLNKIEQNIRNKLLLLVQDDNDRTRSIFGLFGALGKNKPFISVTEFLEIMRGRLQIVLSAHEGQMLAQRYSSAESGLGSDGYSNIDLHVFTKTVFPLQYDDSLFYLQFEERGLEELAAKRHRQEELLKSMPSGGDFNFSANHLIRIMQAKVIENSEKEMQQFLFLRSVFRVPPDDIEDNFVTLSRFSQGLARFGFAIDPNDQRYVFEAVFDNTKKGAILLHDFHKKLMTTKLPPRDRFIKHLKPGAAAAMIPESFQFPNKKRTRLPQTMDEMLQEPKKTEKADSQITPSWQPEEDAPTHSPAAVVERLVPSPPQGMKAYKSHYDRAHEMHRDATVVRVKELDAKIPAVEHGQEHLSLARLKKFVPKKNASPRSPRSPRKVPDHLYHSPVAKARLEKHIRAASMGSPRRMGQS